MKALSLDLRERIVAAYLAGEGSHRELAERFGVGATVVGKLVNQKKNLGTLEPQVHRRGRKPAVAGKALQQLQRHLEQHPDATVRERIAALGLTCTEKTLWQTLRIQLGWRFKKRRAGRQNKTAPMSS